MRIRFLARSVVSPSRLELAQRRSAYGEVSRVGQVKKTSFYKFRDRTNWVLHKFCPPNNVSTYFRACSKEDEGLRPRLSDMGYARLRRSRKARLDDALRRMMASCPAPKRLRVLAEELAALSAAEILKPAWPMRDKL